MRRSWKPTLATLAGVAASLLGTLVVAVVSVTVYLAPPANSVANLSGVHLVVIALGVCLILAGRLVSRTFGGDAGLLAGTMGARPDQGPDLNALEQLGYTMPPEDDESDGDGRLAYEDGDVFVVCGECGAKNDRGFRYCGSCSAELGR